MQDGHGARTKAGWREVALGDCTVINDATYSPKEAWPFINYLDTGSITENRVSQIQKLERGKQKVPTRARRKVQPGDIVYSTVRPNQKHFGLLKSVPDNFLASTGFAVLRGKEDIADTGFLYWFLAQDHIVDYLHSIAETSTSAYPSIKPSDLEQLTVSLPPLAEQREIAHVLGTLDDKIELNRRMNETLEAMARALFKCWFVDFEPVRAKMEGRWRRGESLPGLPAELYDAFPERLYPSELGEIPEGWQVRRLDEIATFLNGLALQKYPPEDDRNLPVIKIAQLRAGHTKSADSASADIPSKYVVRDGDVLFSWSGSLLLDIWSGGDGALNQHLFKVSSSEYPKWLYYHWVQRHLQEFRDIAADKATTMGHIQRRHLKEAATIVPDAATRDTMNHHMQPLLDLGLKLKQEFRTLAAQRDILLPKLVSGEVRVVHSTRYKRMPRCQIVY